MSTRGQIPDRTRFTILEARGPNNPPPGSENWPTYTFAADGRLIPLPAKAATATEPPTPPVETNGHGDYTAERDEQFADQTLDQIVSDIKRTKPPTTE